jgi:hypothetical protein
MVSEVPFSDDRATIFERSDAEMRCGPGCRGIVVVNVGEIHLVMVDFKWN